MCVCVSVWISECIWIKIESHVHVICFCRSHLINFVFLLCELFFFFFYFKMETATATEKNVQEEEEEKTNKLNLQKDKKWKMKFWKKSKTFYVNCHYELQYLLAALLCHLKAPLVPAKCLINSNKNFHSFFFKNLIMWTHYYRLHFSPLLQCTLQT